MTDERIERVAAAMWDARDDDGRMAGPKPFAESPESDEKEQHRLEARAALTALDAEPLGDVLASVPWLACLEVRWTEDEVYRAEAGGFDGRYRGGEGAGPTIADAIRAAVKNAKEDE